ncbi:MAG: hypothetical protein EOO44_19590 [Flavobacterium sp.]|nr:MAG: hypothetical protein EOO44_19590 [Flavobacterium sp.]
MIVHNKSLLDNLVLLEEAESLQNGGFINKEQFNLIKKELPSFKIHRNILVRIGFFLLGSLLYSSISGAISLLGFTASHNDDFLYVCCYLFAIVGFAGSEILSQNHYFRHGLDDAFILGTILNAGFAIGISTEGNSFLAVSIAITIVSLVMYLRYLHLLSLLVFYLALTISLGYLIFQFIEFGQAILPFFMMLYSILTYYICRNLIKNLKEPYYYSGIFLIKNAALILFYLSGNYFIVRELSAILLDTYSEVSPEIPFAWFFWIFTFIVPLAYLYFALKNKDKVLLWIVILSLGFSIFTFRNYYHVLPAEAALTLGGLVLFAIAYFSIKRLKHKESGITFKPDRINNSDSLLNAEALVIASTFGMKAEAKPPGSPMEFGGGGFSGGGSEGSF